MVLINECIDCARFAHANQLCPIPLTLPQETLLCELFADFQVMLANGKLQQKSKVKVIFWLLNSGVASG